MKHFKWFPQNLWDETKSNTRWRGPKTSTKKVTICNQLFEENKDYYLSAA